MAIKTEQKQSQRLALNQQLQLSLQLLGMGNDRLLETVNEELEGTRADGGRILHAAAAGRPGAGGALAGAAGGEPAQELEEQLGAERRPVDKGAGKSI